MREWVHHTFLLPMKSLWKNIQSPSSVGVPGAVATPPGPPTTGGGSMSQLLTAAVRQHVFPLQGHSAQSVTVTTMTTVCIIGRSSRKIWIQYGLISSVSIWSMSSSSYHQIRPFNDLRFSDTTELSSACVGILKSWQRGVKVRCASTWGGPFKADAAPSLHQSFIFLSTLVLISDRPGSRLCQCLQLITKPIDVVVRAEVNKLFDSWTCVSLECRVFTGCGFFQKKQKHMGSGQGRPSTSRYAEEHQCTKPENTWGGTKYRGKETCAVYSCVRVCVCVCAPNTQWQ